MHCHAADAAELYSAEFCRASWFISVQVVLSHRLGNEHLQVAQQPRKGVTNNCSNGQQPRKGVTNNCSNGLNS